MKNEYQRLSEEINRIEKRIYGGEKSIHKLEREILVFEKRIYDDNIKTKQIEKNCKAEWFGTKTIKVKNKSDINYWIS